MSIVIIELDLAFCYSIWNIQPIHWIYTHTHTHTLTRTNKKKWKPRQKNWLLLTLVSVDLIQRFSHKVHHHGIMLNQHKCVHFWTMQSTVHEKGRKNISPFILHSTFHLSNHWEMYSFPIMYRLFSLDRKNILIIEKDSDQ